MRACPRTPRRKEVYRPPDTAKNARARLSTHQRSILRFLFFVFAQQALRFCSARLAFRYACRITFCPASFSSATFFTADVLRFRREVMHADAIRLFPPPREQSPPPSTQR